MQIRNNNQQIGFNGAFKLPKDCSNLIVKIKRVAPEACEGAIINKKTFNINAQTIEENNEVLGILNNAAANYLYSNNNHMTPKQFKKFAKSDLI